MDYFTIRRVFERLSGRHDLADDDSNDVLKQLINAACRNLDRITTHQKSFGTHFEIMAVDAFKADIPQCRSIKEVWLKSATARWQLEKMDLADIVYNYLSSDPDSGAPLYYSPIITRGIPEGTDYTAGDFPTFMTFMDTSTNLTDGINGIVILPPTESQVMAEIKGTYYSKELVLKEDENYWTVNHPILLIKAVMRELNIFNENVSKTTFWDGILKGETIDVEKDFVDQMISEIDQIRD